MSTDSRKQAICEALRTWVSQRPGFDPNNYDRAGYLSDSRMVQRQLHDARELLRAVELSGITADALIAAFPRAFSGRLLLKVVERKDYFADGRSEFRAFLEYCTGQYWCTEYRAAACAVLASALWDYTREECMPVAGAYRVESWTQLGKGRTRHTVVTNREAAALQLKDFGGSDYGSVCELHSQRGACGRITWVSPGDWLRAHFRQQFGRGIQSRWFN